MPAKKRAKLVDATTFEVRFIVTAKVRLSRRLLNQAASPEFQRDTYTFQEPKEVAHHIGFNLLKGNTIKNLDGFANLEHEDAVITDMNWTED